MKDAIGLFLFGALSYASTLLAISFGFTAWEMKMNPARPQQTYELCKGIAVVHMALTVLFFWESFEIFARYPRVDARLAPSLLTMLGILLLAKSYQIRAMSKTYEEGRVRWPFPVYWLGVLLWAILIFAYSTRVGLIG